MPNAQHPFPDWSVDQWLNTPEPISLSGLRCKVVVIEAFQMLRPGCVTHGLPLVQEVHDLLPLLIYRAQVRGDRLIGRAEADLETVHAGKSYDLELQSKNGAEKM
ncbi:hypothetical protein KUV26_22560 [Leisingera daeponensis]|uniref:Uncharacterized protein n=1 Tax=Leisingera daeponensis TaxID=405746 RepID=A0ABS7NQ04_9RHOB|nr:hypothetical protein [Leisingera daeponensis]MBY6142221.1 hypothetical protein [Leisingera daeponensis]